MNMGMKKHVMKATACLATGIVLAAGSSIATYAAGSSLIGVESMDQEEKAAETEANKEETKAETETEAKATTENKKANKKKAKKAETEAVQEETQTEAQPEVVETPSMVGTIAIALPGEDSFVNIRSSASSDSDVVGYLYNSNCATIIGEEGDWYMVQSGNCVGYVANYLLTTGAEAAEAIQAVATPVAQVNASALMVRAEASEDAEVLDMINENEIVYLEEDLGGWARVSTANATGYVNADYVSYASYLPQGETQEEAEIRIAEEEAAYEAWLYEQEQIYLAELEAQQAEWEAQNQAWIEYLQSQGYYAEEAQQAADQAYANQEWADQQFADAEEALNNAYYYGDEYDIAAAEQAYQDAYQQMIDAANAADEAQAEAYAADQAFYDTAAEYGIDTSEVEAADDSASSQRQAIVDYALQFVGNPYVYGGTSLTNGTDCSGFTQGVLANFGINVNRTAGQQSLGGKSVDLANIQPGDLLFYSGDGDYGIGHVSMYIGNGQVVHASSSTTGIIVSDINYRTPTSASNYID